MLKKSYIQYIKNNQGHYEYRLSDSIKMEIIGHFLIDDCHDETDAFKSCMLDNECKAFGGNLIFIEKENDQVILSDDISQQPDGGPYFKISKDEFLRLLDMWEKVYAQKPQEITIAYDGQKFSIETK